jgi:hypothetical protein
MSEKPSGAVAGIVATIQIVREQRFRLSSDGRRVSFLTQDAILKKGRGRHRKYHPWVFTEHGAIMAATILNTVGAVEMSVYVDRTFAAIRGVAFHGRCL